MSEEVKNSKFKKIAIFCFKNIVNVIFCVLTIYYGFLAFILNIAPLENKIMFGGVIFLWLLWLFAKAIITMVLSAIVVILILYGWYYYTHYDQINCKNNGGVWNKEKQICEEKVNILERIKDIWENNTFLKFSVSEKDQHTDKKEEKK